MLLSDPIVREVTLLTRTGERYLLQINWSPDVDSLVRPMINHEADLLRGGGTPDTWAFRAQFQDRAHLVAFRDACLEHDVHNDLLRIYNPRSPTETEGLTDEQLDALLVSYGEGYWKVPRETNLGDLGEQIGISDTAVSQRIRQGVSTLIEEYVLPEADR